MKNHETFVSLDIGTTSIKVVVAEYINGQVNILGVGNEKSRGMSRGVVVDIDETVASIQRAVRQAEEKANRKITQVAVGVPSNQLMIEESHGMVAVSSQNKDIQPTDVANVIEATKVKSVPPEREILSIIPEEFIIDSINGIVDPIGMIGVRLELYASLFTGPRTIIHNIRRCVEKAGLTINELVIQPQAIAEVALSPDERAFGTVVIDMGGGQTSVGIIYGNQLKYTFVDQEGGDFITKDISVILNTSMESAERIKREYGYALPEETSSEEYFPVETIGRPEPVRVDEHYLSEIINARLAQIFETIYEDLKQIDALDLPGGFVITGGGASLQGVLEMAQQYFGPNVRMYVPHQMGIRNPIFTTSMGILEYVANLDQINRIAQVPSRARTEAKVSQQERFEWDQPSPQQVYEEPETKESEPSINKQLFNRPSLKTSRKSQEETYDSYSDYSKYSNEEDMSSDISYDEIPEPVKEEGFAGKVRSFFDSFFN